MNDLLNLSKVPICWDRSSGTNLERLRAYGCSQRERICEIQVHHSALSLRTPFQPRKVEKRLWIHVEFVR